MKKFQVLKQKFSAFLQKNKKQNAEIDKAFLTYDAKNKKLDRITAGLIIFITFVAFVFWFKSGIQTAFVFFGFEILLVVVWFVWFTSRYVRFMRTYYSRKDK